MKDSAREAGVTATCLMPGATETEFFERADMMDTKVGQAEKDDAADVAKTGFDAMMRGDGDVVSRWKNKLMMTTNYIGQPHIFTHENTPSFAWFDRSYRDEVAPPGSPFRPLHDNNILYSGQPIALVVTETFELARYAATLVYLQYEREAHVTDLEKQRPQAYAPTERKGIELVLAPRGNAEHALATAVACVEAEYRMPVEHHKPMEPFATTFAWGEDGTLTVYEKTQGVQNNQTYVRKVFGLSAAEVRVISPFVGGAFGSGLRPQYQLFLAVLAVSLINAMRHGGVNVIEEEISSMPDAKQQQYSLYLHSAVFVEVKVDEDLGVNEVTRVVSAIAGGRILNPKTAR